MATWAGVAERCCNNATDGEASNHGGCVRGTEEQHFWPAVRDRVSGGSKLADHAIGQEDEAKEVLAKLEKLDATDGEFDKLLAEFIPAAREHIAFEQDQVWPGLRQSLSAQEAEQLGEMVKSAKEAAPTRPHPHAPANPSVLRAAGPAVAAADKALDAVTGRGA